MRARTDPVNDTHDNDIPTAKAETTAATSTPSRPSYCSEADSCHYIQCCVVLVPDMDAQVGEATRGVKLGV